MGYRYETLRFEDVKVGEEVPSMSIPITVKRCVMAASAARDWQPLHHDRDYAQKVSKARDMFVGIWFYMGIISRLITDWAGPEVSVCKLQFKMKQPVCAGDNLTVKGKINSTRVEDGKRIVGLDIEMFTEVGQTTTATAEAVFLRL